MQKKRRLKIQDKHRNKRLKVLNENESESSDVEDTDEVQNEDDQDYYRWRDVTKVDDYTIFFCGEISRKNTVTFGRILHKMACKLQCRAWRQGKQYSDDFITVKLTSNGGECEMGLMAADLIMNCSVNIHLN